MEWLLLRAVAVVLLILANGFFVSAEFALVSLRETRLEEMLRRNRIGARAVQRLQARMDDFLPAVQLGVTLASLALGWVGESALAAGLEHELAPLPHLHLLSHALALVLAFICITYFHVLLGELVPKSLALQRVERVALAAAPAMEFFLRVTRPFVAVLNRSARLVLRLFRADLSEPSTIHSPEELKLLATASRRGGMLPLVQEEMVHRAVDLNRVQVREIMTPRAKVFSLPADLPVETASARIVEEQHSRVPVYDPHRGPEQVLGVVYAKDVARLMHYRATAQARFGTRAGGELRLRQIMKEVPVVPETKPVADLLHEFQAQRRHLAVVVDEFGTVAGIVTVEDALEQLVGEVDDEFDITAVPRLHPRSALTMEGGTSLLDLSVQAGIDLPRDAGVETLGGLLMTELGHIPRPGDQVELAGRVFRVLEMEGHRVARVRIEPPAASAQAALSPEQAPPQKQTARP